MLSYLFETPHIINDKIVTNSNLIDTIGDYGRINCRLYTNRKVKLKWYFVLNRKSENLLIYFLKPNKCFNKRVYRFSNLFHGKSSWPHCETLGPAVPHCPYRLSPSPTILNRRSSSLTIIHRLKPLWECPFPFKTHRFKHTIINHSSWF